MTDLGGSLKFDRDFAPPYGTAEQLSPLITRVMCRNPGVFTFTGTASYIIGTKELAVIDPGPAERQHLAALLEAIGGRPVTHIFITHTHKDHSPLAAELKALTGAKTAGFGPHGAGARDRQPAGALDMGSDLHFVPDIRLCDGDVVASGAWRIGAVSTPGHTANHMAYALIEEKALFPGDHVMAWSTSVVSPSDGHMGDYLNSLEKLLEREDEIYWPTHGPPRAQPQGLVRALIAHRRMREGAILARLKEGAASLAQITAAIYAGLDPGLRAAAAQTALAHLQHLAERGRVRREPGAAEEMYRLS